MVALGKKKRATDDSKDADLDAALAAEDLAEEMEEVKTAAELLGDALDELTGGKITTEKALLSYRDSLKSLSDQIDDNGGTLDVNTQKGRDNRKAILSSVDAAFEHAKAIADQTGNVEKATKRFQDHIRELLGVADSAGLSEEAVRDYVSELKLTPKDVKTMLKLLGVEKAKDDVLTLKEMLKGFDGSRSVARADLLITTYEERREGKDDKGRKHHTGGLVGTSGASSFGPALRGDEVPIIAQRGELVFSKAEVSAAARAPASTPARSGTEISIHFHDAFYADDASVRKLADRITREQDKAALRGDG
jgi:hypothetical protein